jgi:hypothetical protein
MPHKNVIVSPIGHRDFPVQKPKFNAHLQQIGQAGAECIPKTSIKVPSVHKYKPHIQTTVDEVLKIKRAQDPHNLGRRAPVQ